jgi:hypothetical protein
VTLLVQAPARVVTGAKPSYAAATARNVAQPAAVVCIIASVRVWMCARLHDDPLLSLCVA